MDRNLQPEKISQPEENDLCVKGSSEVTIPPESAEEILIPVKFNKEMKNLTACEAAEFAQKGMKYDIISNDYGRLRELAAGQALSVGAYIERLEKNILESRKGELLQKCGGDEELAGHILALEQKDLGKESGQLSELQENFPEIKQLSDLPDEVAQTAAERGTSLLDEYLRYRLRCERRAAEAKAAMKAAGNASVGSQRQATAGETAVNSEFLRGLWGR